MLKSGLLWRKIHSCQVRAYAAHSRLFQRNRPHRQPSAPAFIEVLPDGPELQIPQDEYLEPSRSDHGIRPPSDAGQPSEHPELNTSDTSNLEKARSIHPHSLIEFWDTPLPTGEQLTYAHDFFHKNPPTLHFSASRFLHIPFTDVPEVAFLGRSNTGKSSLLNAFMASQVCKVAKKPGYTKTMNAFAIGRKGASKEGLLNVLDMPGYGTGSRDQWGQEILKYLKGRKELKRVFVLVDSTHWIKSSDTQLLRMLAEAQIPHQVLLSKVDKLLFKKKIKPPLTTTRLEDRLLVVKKALNMMRGHLIAQPKFGSTGERTVPAFGQVIACSGQSKDYKHLGEPRLGALGMDSLRWAVLQAVGLTQTEKWAGERRRRAVKKRISNSAETLSEKTEQEASRLNVVA